MIVQEHHIIYGHPDHKSQKDVVVYITKGEHGVLTKIQWWCKNNVSKGFITALKVWIALNEYRAVDMEDKYDRQSRSKKA